MRFLIVLVFAVALVVPALAIGGGAANPASTVGKENFGFAFGYEVQKKYVDEDLATSRRGLGKVIWGATDRLDIYAMLGASNLRVAVCDCDGGDYQGKRAMTWGGGARLGIMSLEMPKLMTYADVGLLSFQNKGTVWRSFEDGYTERYAGRYKWNEFRISLMAVWQRPHFMPYVGCSITSVFGNVSRDVYRISGGVEQFVGRDTNDFREDAIPEVVLGTDIALGGTAKVGCEMRYSADEDISFLIGASELWQIK